MLPLSYAPDIPIRAGPDHLHLLVEAFALANYCRRGISLGFSVVAFPLRILDPFCPRGLAT